MKDTNTTKVIKVLHIINGLRHGGMERNLVELIRYLPAAAISNKVAVLNKPGAFSDSLGSVEVDYLDRTKPKILHVIWKTAQQCRKEGVHIIHVHDSFSAVYGILISMLSGAKLLNGMIMHAGISHGLEYGWDKLLLSLSDKLIANSYVGLDYYRVRGDVIYNPIDLNRFKESNRDLSKIVMTASFSDYKDQETLLRAAHILLQEGKITKIAFIGDGVHRLRIQNLAKKLKMDAWVEFYVGIDSVEDVICEYGVGVLCSTKRYKEGVSNSILEYMGAGLVAVGSNVGATKEIIEDGINGFLFEAENPRSLYNIIKQIQNNANRMDAVRQNAITTLKDKFDPHKNSDKLLGIYRSMKGSRYKQIHRKA